MNILGLISQLIGIKTLRLTHFTPHINQIPDCHEYQGNDCVTVGNGQSLPITHSGNSQLRTISHPFSL